MRRRTIDEAEANSLIAGLAADDWQVPAETRPFDVIMQLAPHLASPDPTLRDEGIIALLGTWIYERDLLSPGELEELLAMAVSDDMLMRDIGSSGTDAVFARSFSLLPIALVLLCDNRHPFLDHETWQHVVERVADYCRRETDFRSRVPGKGFAHAPAHAADVLDEIVRSRYADGETAIVAWEALAGLVSRCPTVFDCDEDLRLSVPLAAMIAAGHTTVARLCEHMAAALPAADDPSAEAQVRRTNWRHLTRSLYFQLLHGGPVRRDRLAPLVALDATLVPDGLS